MSFNNSATLTKAQVLDNKISQSWNKQDTVWMLSLYGTAIGAGTLFLPIDAGIHGILPLVIMTLLAFPMTYFSHRALCRLVLSGSSAKQDITGVMEEHFGRFAGVVLNCLYFFAIYPILLLYSVAITNTTQSFLVNQLGFSPIHRAFLSLALILGLMAIIRFGQETIIKAMSVLVYPFATILLVLSLYLIPSWNTAIFHYSANVESANGQGLLTTLWLMIPVMVFSFNHSPIISSFALSQKRQYGQEADEKSRKILKYSHLMMVVSVLLFVYSCVLSLSPADLIKAKAENISILSYLANHFQTPTLAYLAPIIAFIAISKSFLGHYLGAKEGLASILGKVMSSSRRSTTVLIDFFMIITCWVTATLNPNILKMIEMLGGPVIALFLFVLPIVAMRKVPKMQQYKKNFMSNGFVLLMGLVSISALLYSL
jgi:serine transporter